MTDPTRRGPASTSPHAVPRSGWGAMVRERQILLLRREDRASAARRVGSLLHLCQPFRLRLDAHDVPPTSPSPEAVRFLLRAHPHVVAEMHRLALVDVAELAAYAATGRRRRRPPVTPGVLTVAQASAALGRPERTVRRWLAHGRLQGRQDTPGGVWSVDAESVRSLQSVAA